MQIGVDLGGSHIGVGLVDDKGKIIEKHEKDLLNKEKINIENEIQNGICDNINKILKNQNISINNIKSIGIAVPGGVIQEKNIYAVNLGLRNYNIYDILKKHYNIPIYIRNDAKCASIAEKQYGSLRQYDDAVFLTIGTGIGGSVFLNGKLLKPKDSEGFELGHMIISKEGKDCKCGKKGCFEKYASITALKNNIKEVLNINKDITGEELLKIIQKNHQNEKVQNVLNTYIQDLSTGLINLIEIFKPQAISIGGSFAYYKDIILPKLQEKLKNIPSLFEGKPPEILLAELKNDAGIIGASKLWNED